MFYDLKQVSIYWSYDQQVLVIPQWIKTIKALTYKFDCGCFITWNIDGIMHFLCFLKIFNPVETQIWKKITYFTSFIKLQEWLFKLLANLRVFFEKMDR